MSRFFNGGVQQDQIVFAPGVAPPNQGGITIGSLVKASQSNFTGHIINGYDTGGFSKFGQLVAAASPSRLFLENDFGAGGPIVGTDWCWLVSTHAGGNAQPEHYRYDFSTSTWSHITGSSAVADLSGTTATIVVGNTTAGGVNDSWRGWIAALALWRRPMTFTEIQAVFTRAAIDLYKAAPNWGILLNQSSTSTPVSDFTGNLGNQSSIMGTSVASAEEPPGWDYSLPETLLTDAHTALANLFQDNSPITLATTFKPLVAGSVYGGRYHSGSSIGSGTYELVLWEITVEDVAGSPSGSIVGSATFDNSLMLPNAWNWISFSAPVIVDPAKMYRIGIRTSEGRYSASNYFFMDPGAAAPAGETTGGLTTANMHAPYSGEFFPGLGSFYNGVYDTMITNYPYQTYHGSLYFVDPGFVPGTTTPPSGPTILVWNGTSEVPATLKVWNGTAEVAATVSIA